MALNLNSKVSLPSFGKRNAAAASAYPEKTYINLMPSAAKSESKGRNVLVGVLVAVLVVAFVKFGVVDFYAQVSAKQSELDTQTQMLNTLQAQVAAYQDVASEYEGYEVATMAASGTSVNALDVLAIVDSCVSPYASVTSLTLQGDALLLNLSNTSLDNLGRLTSALEEQPEVAKVSVSSASSKNNSSGTTATVTVDLVVASDSGQGA